MESMKRNISLGLMILVQVQKEVAPLMQIVHSRRIAHLPLRILFLGPHVPGLAILQDTVLTREICFLTVSRGMIPSVRMIAALHQDRRTLLDSTP